MTDRKVVLVTGANKGIGFEIVRQLSRRGFLVILTSRNKSKGMAAQDQLRKENLAIDYLQMDIANIESIQRAFDHVKSLYERLDVLINNAAICLREDRSLLQSELSVIRQTVETNALAQLTVTRIFCPIIPPGGRIIMSSSEGGSMSDPVGGWSPAYCVSKSFLNAMTRHLSYELSDRGISVNAFDPGWVKTDMGGRSAPGSVEQGVDTAVWLAISEKVDTGKFYYSRKEIPW